MQEQERIAIFFSAKPAYNLRFGRVPSRIKKVVAILRKDE